MAEKLLMYKGKALMRSGNEIYYGSTDEKYMVMLNVLDSEDNKDLPISGRVTVSLMSTNPEAKERIMRQSEKKGLYNALDIGAIWLERALQEK